MDVLFSWFMETRDSAIRDMSLGGPAYALRAYGTAASPMRFAHTAQPVCMKNLWGFCKIFRR